jgi:hypothetical protein
MSIKTQKTISRLKKELKMIAVDKSNYDKLRQLGQVPESFNTVVGRLIEEHYQYQNKHNAAGGSGSTT